MAAAVGVQPLLQVQPGQAGHAHVQDDAGDIRPVRMGQEILGGDERPAAETDGPQQVACGSPSVEDRLLHRERLAQFMGAMEALPDRARRVWVLNRVEGMSYPQIAAHLGVSQGTVFNDMKLAMGHFVDALSRAERG